MNKLRLFTTVALLCAGCSDVTVSSRDSPTAPSNVTESKIEFRVNGNATSVRIRISNANDGLSQIVTTMPYTSNLTTKEDSLFVSLEATPIGYSALTVFPFLSVQIFVDGKLFREATSNEFLLNTLSVNGTWRRD